MRPNLTNTRGPKLLLLLAAALVLAFSSAIRRPASAATGPGLVVLNETGEVRDSLPVYRVSPQSEAIARGLSRGFAGRMVRLFGCEQRYLHAMEGTEPEPAYLLISGNEGGFPRFGFCLKDSASGEVIAKPRAGYVDLHRNSDLSGRFGAMDQIYPHELMHVIVRQLAGDRYSGNSNQVHAVGVCTDRGMAWDEGFAESCQAMAIDDPGVDPATKALVSGVRERARAEKALSGYRREMAARFSFATHRRLGFVLWFSQTEQALRYFAVKTNAFARAPVLPGRLVGRDPYRAYLLESILPGPSAGTFKPAARLLSTEGVVSALMLRWAMDETLRNSYREDAFYAPFGLRREEVSPEDNVYLKIFDVLYKKKPSDLAELVRGYRDTFPDEAPAVNRLVVETFGDSLVRLPPEVWLANPQFKIGTSLFDQFRAAPRAHTFDLNAASLTDLMGVPGMKRPLAESILAGAPYAGLDDLSRVKGMTPATLKTFSGMSEEMRRLERGGGEKEESSLTLQSVLMPVLRRALLTFLLAFLCATVLYRVAARAGWVRSALYAFGTSLLALLAGWFAGIATGAPAGICGLAALLLIVLLFGIPSAIRSARSRRGRQRRRSPRSALLAWALVALPAAILLSPWF